MTWSALGVRLARLLTQAIPLAWLGYVIASWFLVWNPADGGAYFDAAVRLRSDEELYHEIHPEAHEAYRYAPWFAYAWIPLSFLPRDVVLHGWSLAMLACSIAAVWPIVRLGTPSAIALGGLLCAFLAETAMFGNAHPLVVAMLSLSAGRTTPFAIAIGVATSIKLVPILFVIPWLARREWHPPLLALAVAAVLWGPVLLFDLTNYLTDPGTGLLSIYAFSPALWAVIAASVGLTAVWLAIRHTRWAWVGQAALMFLGPPRIALSYIGFIAPAVVRMLVEERRKE